MAHKNLQLDICPRCGCNTAEYLGDIEKQFEDEYIYELRRFRRIAMPKGVTKGILYGFLFGSLIASLRWYPEKSSFVEYCVFLFSNHLFLVGIVYVLTVCVFVMIYGVNPWSREEQKLWDEFRKNYPLKTAKGRV